MTVLYRKYFQDRRAFTQRASSRYLTAKTGRLSPFDDGSANTRGFRDGTGGSSRRRPIRNRGSIRTRVPGLERSASCRSCRNGARVKINPADPRQNIHGACHYLWKLDDQLKSDIPRAEERIKFILGSTTSVSDISGRAPAGEKNGDDPKKWDDVAYWLIRSPSAMSTATRWSSMDSRAEPRRWNYVDLIFDRLEHYKGFVTTE